MVSTFNTKFCFGEVKYTLAKVGQPDKYSGEDLEIYIKQFYEKALYCCDLIEEEVLVNICLHGMNDDH